MSSFILRSIQVDEANGEVWMNGTDNNVFNYDGSRPFSRQKSQYYSSLLVKNGREAVDREILDLYDGQMIWRGGDTEYAQAYDLTGRYDYDALIELRAFKTANRGKKAIVHNGHEFVIRPKRRCLRISYKRSAATVFPILKAVKIARRFYQFNWEIV